MRPSPLHIAIVCLAAVVAALPARAQQPQPPPLVPQDVQLAESARRAIDAPWLTDDERAALRVFHGVWNESDRSDVQFAAVIALNAWDVDNPSLQDANTPIELRAEALLIQGRVTAAIDLLADADSARAARVRAEAYETLGRHDAAAEAVAATAQQLMTQQSDSAEELTEAVRGLIVRSRVLGQPARDFQTMMSLLGRAQQELDRLYWPAVLTQAELLLEKHDTQEAVAALHETLALNPRCSQAWYLLGRIAVRTFDFASAERAAAKLRTLNPEHPLADTLLARARLVQDDPEAAMEILTPLLERLPRLREAHALRAAAHALFYDEQAMHDALAAFDELSPGSAMAHATVGRHLSLNRQYETAAAVLEEAIRRQPKWPTPQIELGLMELQSGRDGRALAVLQDVVELDPFNTRAANSLLLLEELAAYEQIETEHFIIRYKPGVDEVMVRMMPEKLEEIHRTVSERFEFEPQRKTVIELMPDHQRFAVRITGMPFIHTIAACTGPVIAMEVPREGRRGMHSGLYDWPRVLQHEYTHTITLAQSQNRIPHWLTEAAAVELERAPRDYNTARMLAQSLEQGTLFDLDEIKWAFVRPRQPGDRSKAYAQGHWMLQYMNEAFSEDAVIRLLDRYFNGMREDEAMPSALGVSRDAFFEGFLQWASQEVRDWGLAASPSVRELVDEYRRNDPNLHPQRREAREKQLQAVADAVAEQIGEPGEGDPLQGDDWPEAALPRVDLTQAMIDRWLEAHPNHPDLLELKVRRLLQEDADAQALVPALEAYARARPLDPMPHQHLARLHMDAGNSHPATKHLEFLDAREDKSPVYAVQLAREYRRSGEFDRALAKVHRALQIDPYSAPTRELAAAIALQAQQVNTAVMHIEALTLLEPNRPQHEQRLQAAKNLQQ